MQGNGKLVDYELNEDGSVTLIGHQTEIVWDKVKGSDAYWRCTCGASSGVFPAGGWMIKNSLEHQVEHVDAFHHMRKRISELLGHPLEDTDDSSELG